MLTPYKTKICEPIPFLSREEREREIEAAGFNVYRLPSEKVTIDFLTDSGTSAMSQEQWSRMILADENLSHSRSYYRFVESAQRITGYEYILPVHQGRSGEHLLFKTVVKEGDYILSNGHYATARQNISFHGGVAMDILAEKAFNPHTTDPFKGELDLESLKVILESKNVPIVVLSITNNEGAGQPVSLKHIREVKEILQKKGIPLFYDACRFAENGYFIKMREDGVSERSIPDIVKDLFSVGDGCFLSMKKDGLSNIGGFLAMNDGELYEKVRNYLLMMEGHFTEGGLAGRDLESMALGLEEAVDESYLAARVEQVRRLGERLSKMGVPVYKPFTAHAVFLLMEEFLPHIPPNQYASVSLACEIYGEGGVRTLPVGTFRNPKKSSSGGRTPLSRPFFEMVRLTVPRRVYSDDHVNYVADVIGRVYDRRDKIQGLKIAYAPPFLEHYVARFERLENS
jgi:tryptophanase